MFIRFFHKDKDVRFIRGKTLFYFYSLLNEFIFDRYFPYSNFVAVDIVVTVHLYPAH